VFLDLLRNRRNDPGHRAAFRAQGQYFRPLDDAGLVADPADLLAAWPAIEDSGRQVVAPFHSHRRRLSTARIRRTAPGLSCEPAHSKDRGAGLRLR
jgi:hypothetical protein